MLVKQSNLFSIFRNNQSIENHIDIWKGGYMNNSNLYDRGCIEISDNFIRFDNTTVSLTNIDHIEDFIFDKHSIFAGIKD